MANTIKFVTKNGLHTQNVDFVSPDETHTIQLSMLNSDTLSISGNSGQLFSINDSQTGTIFAVNDISGVSSIEVLDSGTVRLAETFGSVAIGKATPGDKLDVEGNVRIGVTNSDATLTTNGTGDLILTTNAGTNSGSIRIYDGADGDIAIEPEDAGNINLITDTVRLGSTNENSTLTTNGTADLILSTNSSTNSGAITIYDAANQDIALEPHGTGNVNLLTDTVRLGSSNEDSFITTNGTADLTLNTNAGTNSGMIKIFDGASQNIELQVNGTGTVVINEAGNAADFRVEGDADVNLFFADGSADSIGVGTNAPGAKLDVRGTVIINEDGGDNDVRIEGDADVNLLFTDASLDRVGVGTNAPQNKLHVQFTGVATNTVIDVLRLDRQSSGTPANGIGVGIEFAVETAAGNTEVGAAIEAVAADITATSEDFDLVFRTMIAGAAAAQVGKLNNNTLQVGANGANTTITTQGTADLLLSTNNTSNSGVITIFDAANQNITVEPHGTGNVILYTDTVEIGGSSGAPTTAENVIVTTRNASDLTLSTNNGSNTGTIKIFDGANQNIELQPNGTGSVVINESGISTDFRVESNDVDHMLFVDGDQNRVGVGTNSPSTRFHVANGGIKRNGNISSTAWTTTGIALSLDSATFTDTDTAANADISTPRAAVSLNAPTYAATNTGVELLAAVTLYVENPIAGTNVTISDVNKYAIYNAGNEYIGGSLTVNGDAVFLSQSLSLNGKTVVVGNVSASTGATATAITSAAGTGPYTATLTGVSVALSPGQVLTKTSGPGAFGTNTRVLTVSGTVGAYTVNVEADTAFTNATGAIVFDVSGPTDYSANQGGLILKGTGDKSILWVDSTDSWTFNQSIETTGKVKTGNFVQDGTLTASLSTTSETSVDSTSATLTKSIKYIIEAKYSTSYQYSEIMLVTDGTNAFLTEYANVFTSADALVSYDADINGGNIRLLATAATATTTLKILKTYVV